MKLRKLFVACSISLICFSCAKEKLDGDKAHLVGNWIWKYSIVYKFDPDYQIVDTINSWDHPNNYKIEFEEKGSNRT